MAGAVVETNLPAVIAAMDRAMAEVSTAVSAELEGIVRETRAALVLAIRGRTPYDAADQEQHLEDTTVPDSVIEGTTATITIHQTKTVYWRREGIDYPLARILIDGITEEYPIAAIGKPDGADALYWPGAEHPVRSVMHPAMDPDDYPDKGMADAEPDLEAIFAHSTALVMEAIAERMTGVAA